MDKENILDKYSHKTRRLLRNEKSTSNTVQSLLSQNDDLIVRVRHLILQNQKTEDKYDLSQEEILKWKKISGRLEDNIILLRQKNKILNERCESFSHQIVSLKDFLKIHKDKNAKNFHDEQKKREELYNKIQEISLRLRVYAKYKRKIKPILEGLRKKARDYDSLMYYKNELSIENSDLKEQNLFLSEEKKKLKSEMELLKEGKKGEYLEEKAQYQNQLVTEQRAYKRLEEQMNIEVDKFEKETIGLKEKIKTHSMEMEEKDSEKEKLSETLHEAKMENSRLTEQLESVSTFWKESQGHIAKLEQKNDSFQKLNQSLSVSLKEARQEIENLREKVLSCEMTAKEKIKEVEMKLELYKSESFAKTLQENSQEVIEATEGHQVSEKEPLKASRFEKLVSDIKSNLNGGRR